MEACKEFLSGAAMNGTMSTDMGILCPDAVSTLTHPTEIGWGNVCSAPNGAMATCSVSVGIKLSLVATGKILGSVVAVVTVE